MGAQNTKQKKSGKKKSHGGAGAAESPVEKVDVVTHPAPSTSLSAAGEGSADDGDQRTEGTDESGTTSKKHHKHHKHSSKKHGKSSKAAAAAEAEAAAAAAAATKAEGSGDEGSDDEDEDEDEDEGVEEEGMVFCKEEADAAEAAKKAAESGAEAKPAKAPVKVTADDFQLLKVIGKGSFGKVMQVRKKDTGKIYAMKVLQKEAIINRNQVIHTRSEKSILQMVQHPFIVCLHYAFQTRDKLYMILDYVNGGELFFHLKQEGKFSESRVKFYTAEISLALHHLHKLGIVYRDLKPENILLNSEGHIVITDFGLSKQMMVPASGDTSEAKTHTFCGTPEYLAPEVLRGQGHGTPVDWWSLGTLVYEMLTGLPPFYSANTNVMYQKILSSELRFPPDMSPDCRSFLSGLLERDPAKRMNGDDVMKHPWLSSIDWDKLYRKEIPPPWKPPVTSEADTTQIDRAFLIEPIKDTPPTKGSAPINDANADNQFEGFTFANPADIANAGAEEDA